MLHRWVLFEAGCFGWFESFEWLPRSSHLVMIPFWPPWEQLVGQLVISVWSLDNLAGWLRNLWVQNRFEYQGIWNCGREWAALSTWTPWTLSWSYTAVLYPQCQTGQPQWPPLHGVTVNRAAPMTFSTWCDSEVLLPHWERKLSQHVGILVLHNLAQRTLCALLMDLP